jgi:ParB-like chromosome segregation protein Spo0J
LFLDEKRKEIMLTAKRVPIDDIYIPTARRKTLHPETVRVLAEDILENGLKAPIRIRFDGKRYILVEGLHRMEAMKWLGDTEIDAYLVHAQKH